MVDVADDLRHRDEPGLLEIRVEFCARDQPYRLPRGELTLRLEAPDLLQDDALDVTGAATSLTHGGGVDVQLNAGLPAGLEVGLESGRDVDDEGEAAGVHGRIDLIHAQRFGRQKERRQQRVYDPTG